MKRILKRSKQLLALMAGIVIFIASCKKDDIIATNLTLSDASTTIQVGATKALTAILTPADATNKTIKWRSASQAIATVDNGVVTGVSLGTVDITAVSQSDTTVKSTCSVLVIPSTGQVINC